MSWWVSLEQDGKPVEVERHWEGGTFTVGGSTLAEINITYNYGFFYRHCLHPDGLWWLDGKRARDCVGRLEAAIKELGASRYRDYWTPTPSNAGFALSILLAWAKEHPEATFRVR